MRKINDPDYTGVRTIIRPVGGVDMFSKSKEYKENKEKIGKVLDDFLTDFHTKLFEGSPDDLLSSLNDRFIKKELGNALEKMAEKTQSIVLNMERNDRFHLLMQAIENSREIRGITKISPQTVRDALRPLLVKDLIDRIEVFREACKHHIDDRDSKESPSMGKELLEHYRELKKELQEMLKTKNNTPEINKTLKAAGDQLEKLGTSITASIKVVSKPKW